MAVLRVGGVRRSKPVGRVGPRDGKTKVARVVLRDDGGELTTLSRASHRSYLAEVRMPTAPLERHLHSRTAAIAGACIAAPSVLGQSQKVVRADT